MDISVDTPAFSFKDVALATTVETMIKYLYSFHANHLLQGESKESISIPACLGWDKLK